MTYSISERLANLASKATKSAKFWALAVVAAFTLVAMQPAQAQSSDTWKSVAIIGGSTAAGAIIGHKVGGTTGAFIGAAVGGSAGYAIDKRRRQNQYDRYGDNGYYGNYDPYNGDNGGYYGNNGGYYGNNGGYYGNGGYSDAPYDNGGYAYPAGYQSNQYPAQNNRSCRQRR